jgi:hypothetical protein
MSLNPLEVRDLQFRKARRSAGNGACVEVARGNDHILVRDSKDQDGPMVMYPMGCWQAFLRDAMKGRFDLVNL